MLVRIVLACVVAFALAAGTSETSRAAAPLGLEPVALHSHYDLYYWTPGHPETKRLYRAYVSHADADHAAHHLQEKGYATQIVAA